MVCDLVDAGYFADHPQVATVTGDIGDHGRPARRIATAVDRFGQADILVNDAASYPERHAAGYAADAWDRVFSVTSPAPS